MKLAVMRLPIVSSLYAASFSSSSRFCASMCDSQEAFRPLSVFFRKSTASSDSIQERICRICCFLISSFCMISLQLFSLSHPV